MLKQTARLMTSEDTSLIERAKVTTMKTKNLSIFQQQTQV